ncbi:hypothetical protein SAMN04488009_1784 [Maribacter sedimenticola]|uniref:TolB-like 6-blade propeller-like n=1 Tax=Maribacter sedimenticola TaxID=228956 RepID=A0ABY1SG73_9FLAO|nr:hypothetical protein [Maribacter sedimenticola]SNR44534.1 hypothetical protein SAMN04488009_1784 [Maribacter sedimenticola]
MKTYNYVAYIGMALSILACDTVTNIDTEEPSSLIDADYTVILEKDGRTSAVILAAAEDGMELKEESAGFEKIPNTTQNYRDKQSIGYYYTNNCQAFVQVFNAQNDNSFVITAFTDINPCDIEVTAIAYTENAIYIAYIQELAGKNDQFAIRSISRTGGQASFVDIMLDKKPVDMIPSTGRLFVLTANEYVDNAYYLTVIDEESKGQLTELDMGNDAAKLLRNHSNQVIVAYPELHTTLDPVSLDKTYTMYGKGTEPGFLTARDVYMDSSGQIYYQKTESSAVVNTVPAIYNFERNSTVVYLFENFLTESEMDVKYNIGATTAIGYDDANGFILIGYQKKNQLQHGGILRVGITPDFKLIDHIDLEGVPQSIFVK